LNKPFEYKHVKFTPYSKFIAKHPACP